MTTAKQLSNSFDSLAKTILEIKAERDKLKTALVSAIVCDTCLGVRVIANQCEACLVGDGGPCKCDEMPEFDCPQCDGRGWSHREAEKHKEICQALYDEQLNYLKP
jgi:hypothetical protein